MEEEMEDQKDVRERVERTQWGRRQVSKVTLKSNEYHTSYENVFLNSLPD